MTGNIQSCIYSPKGLTVLPCPGAVQVEQVPRWPTCPCGSAQKSACVIPGFLRSPENIKTQPCSYWQWTVVVINIEQHDCSKCTEKSWCLTLCCSSFLWRTLAVSSWTSWRGMSSLRAISARWSQAPITPRGPGRDLSRWMCQSSSCDWQPWKTQK